jgi:hypothetical protein
MTIRRVADAFSSFVAIVFEIESGLVVKMEVLNSNDFVLPLMLEMILFCHSGNTKLEKRASYS